MKKKTFEFELGELIIDEKAIRLNCGDCGVNLFFNQMNLDNSTIERFKKIILEGNKRPVKNKEDKTSFEIIYKDPREIGEERE